MDYLTGTLLAFIGISALVIMTPGPDTAMTIRNTLMGGRAGGIATALGVSTGLTIWALATSAGLAALLIASEPLFLAVKYAGAVYLIWLGLQSLRAAWRPGGASILTATPARGRPALPTLSPRAAFRQGVISDLGNAKIAVFFTSLLPQFAPHGPSGDSTDFAALAGLGLLFGAMTLLWLSGYALAVARLSHVLRRPRIRRTLDSITGITLIALGIRIAAEER
ncbi:MAG: LysE family translocator [Reyranella sp.]|uniref:LysE family translocator n=1 Tax=Reyranella sp. TaxID=1929291 RepID=UPI0025F301B8|nr:LysE family translocator [Reyranella sp.]MBR2815487.1 LysE family translocator [Reyranella sp.]